MKKGNCNEHVLGNWPILLKIAVFGGRYVGHSRGPDWKGPRIFEW